MNGATTFSWKNGAVASASASRSGRINLARLTMTNADAAMFAKSAPFVAVNCSGKDGKSMETMPLFVCRRSIWFKGRLKSSEAANRKSGKCPSYKLNSRAAMPKLPIQKAHSQAMYDKTPAAPYAYNIRKKTVSSAESSVYH